MIDAKQAKKFVKDSKVVLNKEHFLKIISERIEQEAKKGNLHIIIADVDMYKFCEEIRDDLRKNGFHIDIVGRARAEFKMIIGWTNRDY